MSLVVQVDATDEASLDHRVLYVFGCNTAQCSAEQAAWSVIRAQCPGEAYEEPEEPSTAFVAPKAAFEVTGDEAWGGGDAWGAAPEEPKLSVWGEEPAGHWGASTESATWGAAIPAEAAGGTPGGGVDDEISKLLEQRDLALDAAMVAAVEQEQGHEQEPATEAKQGDEPGWGLLPGVMEEAGVRVAMLSYRLTFAWEPEARHPDPGDAHIQVSCVLQRLGSTRTILCLDAELDLRTRSPTLARRLTQTPTWRSFSRVMKRRSARRSPLAERRRTPQVAGSTTTRRKAAKTTAIASWSFTRAVWQGGRVRLHGTPFAGSRSGPRGLNRRRQWGAARDVGLHGALSSSFSRACSTRCGLGTLRRTGPAWTGLPWCATAVRSAVIRVALGATTVR